MEISEIMAPEWFEDPGEVALNAVFGAVSPFADIATTSEGGLGAGPSEWPSDRVRWVLVQLGVPEEFVRAEREEDEIWDA